MVRAPRGYCRAGRDQHATHAAITGRGQGQELVAVLAVRRENINKLKDNGELWLSK